MNAHKRNHLEQSLKENWKVGDACNYHARIGGPVTTSGHIVTAIGIVSEQVVAWISGKSGCVSLAALSKPT